MGRYALVDQMSGRIVNVIEWDGDKAIWQEPAGHMAVEDSDGVAAPGGLYANGRFEPPPPEGGAS